MIPTTFTLANVPTTTSAKTAWTLKKLADRATMMQMIWAHAEATYSVKLGTHLCKARLIIAYQQLVTNLKPTPTTAQASPCWSSPSPCHTSN